MSSTLHSSSSSPNPQFNSQIIPQIEVLDQQKHQLDIQFLSEAWQQATASLFVQEAGELGSELRALAQVSFVLLNDETIAQVHGDFLADPTPTDVITFHHGEVLISVETAAKVAAELGHSTEAEVLLYGIHGLVHLHGYSDGTALEKAKMEAIQEPIWHELRR